MTHEPTPAGEKPASGGCCGGKGKDKENARPVAKPDAKPTSVTHDDHKKTGGSCC